MSLLSTLQRYTIPSLLEEKKKDEMDFCMHRSKRAGARKRYSCEESGDGLVCRKKENDCWMDDSRDSFLLSSLILVWVKLLSIDQVIVYGRRSSIHCMHGRHLLCEGRVCCCRCCLQLLSGDLSVHVARCSIEALVTSSLLAPAFATRMAIHCRRHKVPTPGHLDMSTVPACMYS
uniref:Uncharacterized protein n=1 Tax=Onchocerca volvulus TaxID=6282 RepID=A0A8R1TK07_ONCVO